MAETEGKPLGEFQVMVTAYRCRCGYEWTAKSLQSPVVRPRVCPECKSARWDQPKKWERPKKSKE